MVGALMLGWVGAAAAMAPVVPACVEPQALVREREPLVGTVQWTARLWLRGYQELISPADGRACRFFPSCSTYTLQAVHRHGPLRGVVMGLERVQRNHDGWHYSPCRRGGAVLLADPLSDNDWWFRPAPVGSPETQETP